MTNSLSTAILQGWGDLFFPTLCEHCLSTASATVPLCWRCVRRLDRVEHGDEERILRDLPVPAREISVQCLWYYDRDGPLRDVIHALKYQNRPWYGRFLGKSMAAAMSVPDTVDAIFPLPLHRVRRLERGYNQSAWIAAEISRITRIPLAGSLLIREKATQTQTLLTREERWSNLSHAFSVVDGAVGTATHALLVDDVVTTGATALSAALALQRTGITSVTVAAAGLARA